MKHFISDNASLHRDEPCANLTVHSLKKGARKRLQYPVIIGYLVLILVLSACSSLNSIISSFSATDPIHIPRTQTIYIQSMTGQNVTDFQNIFFDTVKEQNMFEFVELLPDELAELQILRLEMKDFTLWENEELSPTSEENVLSLDNQPDRIVRRNANISVKVSLFNAETGKRLVDQVFSQPYQQIFVGEKAIKSRPDRELEINRLTRLTIFRILSAFKMDRNERFLDRLENGVSEGWVSKYIMDFGDDRIKKGNRLAEAGEHDQAVLVWKLALFQPSEAQGAMTSIRNRATAYYNLGVLYGFQEKWWLASDMFSKANRLHQDIKYAQAWGESVQKWLDIKKNPALAKSGQPVEAKADSKKEVKYPILIKLPKTIQNIEKNDQLLLRPRELWPLEPSLKETESFDADY